jgi:hypothetical protein
MKVNKILYEFFVVVRDNRNVRINLIALLLGVIASLTTLGFIIDKPYMSKFGRATGFAPLPLPFRNMGEGRESMKFSYAFYEKKNQGDSWHEVESAFAHVTERPHRMGIPFEAVIGFRAEVPVSFIKSVLLYECKFHNAEELLSVVSFEQGEPLAVKVVCKK